MATTRMQSMSAVKVLPTTCDDGGGKAEKTSVGGAPVIPRSGSRSLALRRAGQQREVSRNSLGMTSHPEPSSNRLMEAQSSRNEDWNTVQRVVMSLFQHRTVTPAGPFDLYDLNLKLLNLMKTEIAPFLGTYYREQLLKRGMIVMREAVREENPGQALLDHLGEVWVRFLSSILPTLQAIFYPLQTSSSSNSMSVRNMSLLGFRDIIVLKLPIQESVTMEGTVVPPTIVQMLLVLSSVHDFKDASPNERYLKLEELIALTVSPFLKPAAMLKKQSESKGDSPSLKRHSGSRTLPRNSSSMSNVHETVQRGKTFGAIDSPPLLSRKGQIRHRKFHPASPLPVDNELEAVHERNGDSSDSYSSVNVQHCALINGSDQPPAINVVQASPALKRVNASEQQSTGSESSGGDTLDGVSPQLPLKVHRTVSIESASSGPVAQTPDSPARQQSSGLDSPDLNDGSGAVVSTALV